MANYYTLFSLRISEELLSKIKRNAARNKRSTNKEIEYILEQYVQSYEDEHGTIEVDL